MISSIDLIGGSILTANLVLTATATSASACVVYLAICVVATLFLLYRDIDDDSEEYTL